MERKITIGDVVLVTFIVLKLTEVIDWDWLWILAPLWIGAIYTRIVSLCIAFLFSRDWENM